MPDSLDLIQITYGVPRYVQRRLKKNINLTVTPPFSVDTPEFCILGESYWHQYSLKDYTYQFNSHGFRDQDHDQYQGKKVNICMGDSMTTNIGGPIEHSWPYLLGRYFSIPTLNISVPSISCHDMLPLVEYYRSKYDVQRVFVLYNIFETDSGVIQVNYDISRVLSAFRKYSWIPEAYWQFDPPWTFTPDDLKILREMFPQGHNYLRFYRPQWHNIDISAARTCEFLRAEYEKISGPSWITYDKFVESMAIDAAHIWEFFPDREDQRMIREFVTLWFSILVSRNRDGYHMSLALNQRLANYFYQQCMRSIH